MSATRQQFWLMFLMNNGMIGTGRCPTGLLPFPGYIHQFVRTNSRRPDIPAVDQDICHLSFPGGKSGLYPVINE